MKRRRKSAHLAKDPLPADRAFRCSTGPDDPRYVLGSLCNWHGRIQEAYKFEVEVSQFNLKVLLPICPWCASPLYELEDASVWWDWWERFAQARGMAHYAEWVEQLRKKHCTRFSEWDSKQDYDDFVASMVIQ